MIKCYVIIKEYHDWTEVTRVFLSKEKAIFCLSGLRLEQTDDDISYFSMEETELDNENPDN
jgi:hypothetical protein